MHTEKEIILDYDDFVVYKEEGKYYVKDMEEESLSEVVLIGEIDLSIPENDTMDIVELTSQFPDADITGEHFHELKYLYFKEVGENNE